MFETEPYRVGSRTYERYRSGLTGRYWLVQRVGFYEYRVVDTRSWNGTRVRVLRDTVDQPTVLGPDGDGCGEYVLNSTVYVDRRGLIRHVSHVREYEYDRIGGLANRTEVDTFEVEDVGRAQVHRPAAFCVTNPSAVRTKDGADPGNSTAGPTGADASTAADPAGRTTGPGVSSPGDDQTATDVTG